MGIPALGSSGNRLRPGSLLLVIVMGLSSGIINRMKLPISIIRVKRAFSAVSIRLKRSGLPLVLIKVRSNSSIMKR